MRREALIGVDRRSALRADANCWTPSAHNMLADGIVLAVFLARDREMRRRREADLAEVRRAGIAAPA